MCSPLHLIFRHMQLSETSRCDHWASIGTLIDIETVSPHAGALLSSLNGNRSCYVSCLLSSETERVKPSDLLPMAQASTMHTPWRTTLMLSLEANKHLAHHTCMQLSTVRPDGRGSNRTVIFRGFHGDCDHITFATDTRHACLLVDSAPQHLRSLRSDASLHA